MEEASLFSLPEGMSVEHIQITEHGLVIDSQGFASHIVLSTLCSLLGFHQDSLSPRVARRTLRRTSGSIGLDGAQIQLP